MLNKYMGKLDKFPHAEEFHKIIKEVKHNSPFL